jgi:hypothetical protein
MRVGEMEERSESSGIFVFLFGFDVAYREDGPAVDFLRGGQDSSGRNSYTTRL